MFGLMEELGRRYCAKSCNPSMDQKIIHGQVPPLMG